MDPKSVQEAEGLYRSLKTFAANHIDSAAELEVLPSSYPLPSASEPILQESNCLAIRKRDLAAAYMVAHRSFFHGSQSRSDEGSVLLDTFILIFFASEHLTAVNWRKRYVEQCIAEVGDHHGERTAVILRRELHILDTFCTSPLAKHTKSPTLWQHRYWVMAAFVKHAPSQAPSYKDELLIVLRAAEKHFANYTAFDYARRLWTLMSSTDGMLTAEVVANMPERGLNRVQAMDLVRKFCFSHSRDVSGWTLLLFLIHEHAPLQETAVAAVHDFVRDTGCNSKAIDQFIRGTSASRQG